MSAFYMYFLVSQTQVKNFKGLPIQKEIFKALTWFTNRIGALKEPQEVETSW